MGDRVATSPSASAPGLAQLSGDRGTSSEAAVLNSVPHRLFTELPISPQDPWDDQQALGSTGQPEQRPWATLHSSRHVLPDATSLGLGRNAGLGKDLSPSRDRAGQAALAQASWVVGDCRARRQGWGLQPHQRGHRLSRGSCPSSSRLSSGLSLQLHPAYKGSQGQLQCPPQEVGMPPPLP